MSEEHKTVDPSKKRRKRRNYDDYDAAVDKEEKEIKKQTKGTENTIGDVDSESDLDDDKLDIIMAKELAEDDDEDDLQEIDSSNIITSGRRTRGKIIDYKKAAKELDEQAKETEIPVETKDGDDEDEDAEFKA